MNRLGFNDAGVTTSARKRHHYSAGSRASREIRYFKYCEDVHKSTARRANRMMNPRFEDSFSLICDGVERMEP